MDDDLLPLESELKRLRPASPSPALVARVGASLERKSGPRASGMRWWFWAALPAAAAVAMLLVRFSSGERAERPAAVAESRPAAAVSDQGDDALRDRLKPVAAENVLVSARDEGVVTLDDGTPARRERFQFVDTYTWKNPHTRTSLTWSVPREEVRVVPVHFQ